ncbi:TauD/TfdA dioxygenase family protein [Rhodococcus sp. B50]|uniref:TauD/TfdA dioxygenase family protein n=1 Tax=Rhodococcus sp. B50 TaxID=2682847 RepID=UPI001BD33D90|nr:TauD/TfdA family dioxygenase [Rhodococcus sp. B50]MBS9376080.1 (S)-phenoxypropionate/alpha-ketoglutarate-dioxygenase [Rhodococcus sp. B50]
MPELATKKLGETIGAEVLDVDVNRLLNDEDLPAALLDALEEHGVLLFREVNLDDESQVAFARRLGTLVKFPNVPPAADEIMEVSFDPANGNAEYLAANAFWHIDGLLDEVVAKASILTARVLSESGGETEFASTYAAYEDLSDDEKERYADLHVVHTFETQQRLSYPDPTPAQLAEWASRKPRTHPLVWTHESGRRSLIFGNGAAEIVGMDPEEGKALLKELEAKATTPDKVFQHTWTVGDMVIWDNTGCVHRVLPFDKSKPRIMNRTTLAGREPIK